MAEICRRLHETRNRPTILDIGNETDISEDEKGFPSIIEEVELVIKEMKNGSNRSRWNPR